MHRLLVAVGVFFAFVPSGSAMRWLDDPPGDTTPPAITVPSDITAEASGPGGAPVSYDASVTDETDPSPTLTCMPASGASFGITTTTVTCHATDASGNFSDASFNVTVQDTTAPVLDQPPPVNVNFGDPVNFGPFNATDLVDGSISATCTPASGSSFPVGPTTVTCTAADSHNNSVSKQFTVTVSDAQAPSFGSPPSPITVEAAGAGGTFVSFTTPVATDNAGPPTVLCSPASGSLFAITVTNVVCTATDGSGNSATTNFNVTVQDTTPPTLTLPGNQNVETENPGGTAVTYSVTASDIVSGSITPSCNHTSGDTFPIGTTAVHCTATDGAGKSSSGDFNVTVAFVDHTPPVLSGYANKTVEANGPAGSVVNYPAVSATDTLDGPIASVPCSPASGTTFPLGTTAVNCSATDAHGNTGHATFYVAVSDTTPPAIYLPTGASIVATSVTGISSSEPAAQAYLQAVRAVDMIDPHPVVTYDVASHLTVGPNPITFHARDASGNESVLTTTLTVLPFGTPAPATPTPRTPPADVTNVKLTPLDGAARIQWQAGGREVMVTRSTSSTRSFTAIGDESVVYTGTASSYTDRGLTNGVEYRYVVMAVDAAGNHSAGVAAVIVPRRNLLKSPKDGARLKKAPKLLWALDSEAQYYNAQLLLNGKKILSAWPVRPTYKLKKSWKFEGRKYTLKPGLYTWFVWPGYGARSAVDYGDLMGSRTFRIVR